ncbi:DUF6362 family protein [Methylocystis sp. WRRC1]|uniref:DUF6362 family protein n=1 Tax=Methylocystis sp. WRRC1 TaxID=1732014 RepID=UPI001D147F77|nr:DUF6362 family protein [Methylocystis sp. WRRC1]MCC3246695.1 DUF6362 family protein [Methylocystis sp. WRRC1]
MDEWTKEIVFHRYLEAADVLRRLPPVRFPKEFGNAWPDVLRDMDDIRGHDPDERVREFAAVARRAPPPAAAITRQEEVNDWTNRYLRAWPGPRRVLLAYALCVVAGLSFRALCRKRGWARTTAMRRIDKALLIVRDGLSKDNIALRMADVDFVGQMEPNPPHEMAR